MANDHRGRDVHAGKRTDDDGMQAARERVARMRENMADIASRKKKYGRFDDYDARYTYTGSEPLLEEPEEGYRTDNIKWDNPESYG